jgi:hypothetical protein
LVAWAIPRIRCGLSQKQGGIENERSVTKFL